MCMNSPSVEGWFGLILFVWRFVLLLHLECGALRSSKPSLFRQQFLRTQSKTSGFAGKKRLRHGHTQTNNPFVNHLQPSQPSSLLFATCLYNKHYLQKPPATNFLSYHHSMHINTFGLFSKCWQILAQPSTWTNHRPYWTSTATTASGSCADCFDSSWATCKAGTRPR